MDYVMADLRSYLGVPLSARLLRQLEITTPWIIEDLLPPMGRLILAAPPKVGKSLLAQQLAHCIALGEPFLGMENHSGPLRVHYIDYEVGPVFTKARLEAMAPLYPDADENIFITMFPPGEPEDAMRKVKDVGLFIIDPISAIRMEDENNNAQVRRRLDDIARVARDEYGAAVLVVHHMRKQSRDPENNWYMGLGEARGAGAFYDWVDGGMALRELDRTTRTFELRFGTRGSETPDPLVIVRDPETLTYAPKHAIMGGPALSREDFIKAHEEICAEMGKDYSKAELVRRLGERFKRGRSTIYRLFQQAGIDMEEER